jgi:uncharacterized protein YdeI (YjbR/CyaY-like superfamily)
MPNLDQLERYYARSREEWREWLEKNHQTSPGIWFIYYKKGTEEQTVTYEDAVEDALSFGWIDSKVNALDEKRYMQVFTPRKPGSTWSKLNKNRVKKLIKQGLMTPAGLEKIELAMKDGSWYILDDVEDLILPDDLKKALEVDEKAEQNFHQFNDSSKKQILWWVVSAKRPETRERRIKKVVDIAHHNQKPYWL